MKVRFLGYWSAFIRRGVRHTSILVDDEVAMDFGPHSLESLLEMGVDPMGIRLVLITHMHLDHFMGLPELLWYRAAHKPREEMAIVGPPGIDGAVAELLRLANTPEHFDFRARITSGPYEGVSIARGDHSVEDWAYRLEVGGAAITYSGDTAFSEAVVELADGSDVLVHEATYSSAEPGPARRFKHSTVSDALRAMELSGSRALVPVHLSDGSLEESIRTSGVDPRVKLPTAPLEA